MQAFPIAWTLAVVLLCGVFFLYEVSSTGIVTARNCCQYHLVADMSAVSPFTGSHLPSIDNKDDVAFAANKVETAPSISSDAVENPSINDAGTVAYNKSSISRLAVLPAAVPLSSRLHSEISNP